MDCRIDDLPDELLASVFSFALAPPPKEKRKEDRKEEDEEDFDESCGGEEEFEMARMAKSMPRRLSFVCARWWRVLCHSAYTQGIWKYLECPSTASSRERAGAPHLRFCEKASFAMGRAEGFDDGGTTVASWLFDGSRYLVRLEVTEIPESNYLFAFWSLDYPRLRHLRLGFDVGRNQVRDLAQCVPDTCAATLECLEIDMGHAYSVLRISCASQMPRLTRLRVTRGRVTCVSLAHFPKLTAIELNQAQSSFGLLLRSAPALYTLTLALSSIVYVPQRGFCSVRFLQISSTTVEFLLHLQWDFRGLRTILIDAYDCLYFEIVGALLDELANIPAADRPQCLVCRTLPERIAWRENGFASFVHVADLLACEPSEEYDSKVYECAKVVDGEK